MVVHNNNIIAINNIPSDVKAEDYSFGILPDGDYGIILFQSEEWQGDEDGEGNGIIRLPDGLKSIEVVGIHGHGAKLTEEQCQQVVYSGINDNETYYQRYDRVSAYCTLKSARRSFDSWMKVNDLYLQNPYGKVVENRNDTLLFPKWKAAEKRIGPFLIIKVNK